MVVPGLLGELVLLLLVVIVRALHIGAFELVLAFELDLARLSHGLLIC